MESGWLAAAKVSAYRLNMSNVEEVVEAVRRMSSEEREIVADLVLDSLDSETLTTVDRAWLKEAEQRYERYQADKSTGVSLDSVLDEIRYR